MKSQIYISKKGFIILLFGTIILSVSSKKPADILQDNKWVAPAWADKMKNPFANTENATTEDKKTYNKLCWFCHGK